MAEAFGLAAGVLQVASFGAEVGSTLWRCAKKFQNASKELEDAASQVETIALSLRRVDALLQDPSTKALHTPKLYEDTAAVSDGCNEVFRELDKYVKGFESKSSSGKMTMLSRARWTFDGDKVRGLGQVLRRYNDVLHLMISVMAIVEGRRAATKDELQALEAHLQILAISNRDLSQSNKSLTDTIAAISRAPVEPVGSKMNVSSLPSTTNTLGVTGGLYITSFTAMPAENTFPAAPRQPESHLKMTDHLQRCMQSVQDLAQTISCALNALHGHEKTGSSDVHGSYAKLAANLDRLPTNVQCVHCQRKIALPHFECAKNNVIQAGACLCMSSSSPSLWVPVDLPGRHERQRGDSVIASGSTDLTTGNKRANIAHSTRLRFPDHPAIAQEQQHTGKERIRHGPLGPDQKQRAHRMRKIGGRPPSTTQYSIPPAKAPMPRRDLSEALALQDYQQQLRILEAQNQGRTLMARQTQENTQASSGVTAETDLTSAPDRTPNAASQPLTLDTRMTDEYWPSTNHPKQTRFEQQRKEVLMGSHRQQQVAATQRDLLMLQQQQYQQQVQLNQRQSAPTAEAILQDDRYGPAQQEMQQQRQIESEHSSGQQPSISTTTPDPDATVDDTALSYTYDTFDLAGISDTGDWKGEFGYGQAQPTTSGSDWYCPCPSGEDVPRPLTQDYTSPPHTIAGEAKIGLVDPSLIQPFDPVQSRNAQYPDVPAIHSPQIVAYPMVPSPEPARTSVRCPRSPPHHDFGSPPVPPPEPHSAHAERDCVFTPIDDSRSLLAQEWGTSGILENGVSRTTSTDAAEPNRGKVHRTLSESHSASAPLEAPPTQATAQPPPRVANNPSSSNIAVAVPSSIVPDVKRPRLKIQVPSAGSDDTVDQGDTPSPMISRDGASGDENGAVAAFEPVTPFDSRSTDFSHASQSIDDALSSMQPVCESLGGPMGYRAGWPSFDITTSIMEISKKCHYI